MQNINNLFAPDSQTTKPQIAQPVSSTIATDASSHGRVVRAQTQAYKDLRGSHKVLSTGTNAATQKVQSVHDSWAAYNESRQKIGISTLDNTKRPYNK